MTMIRAVLANLFAPSRSRAPTDRVPAPPELRGLLLHDAGLCTGCGTCAHVCAPKAITVAADGDRAMVWEWYSGACSYCGLCAIWCPSRAIALEPAAPETADRGSEIRIVDETPLVPCSRCGRPHVPMPQAMQAEMLCGPLEGVAADEREFCEDCRRRTSSARIRDGFLGAAAPRAGEGR